MNYLITGVSSGIGRALTKKLVGSGNTVWGTARRKELLVDLKKELHNSPRFIYTAVDQGKENDWKLITRSFKGKKIFPQVIIFNAAVSENDLESYINLKSLEKTFEVNFLGIMRGVNNLLPIVKTNSQFIAISSFSALKGNSSESIGYASSKAALSIAFESLHQKYKEHGIIFKTIFFGPINSGMSPFKKGVPFALSEDKAVESIINAVKSKEVHHYYPKSIFFIFRLIKLLPSSLYFKILSRMDSIHLKFKEDVN